MNHLPGDGLLPLECPLFNVSLGIQSLIDHHTELLCSNLPKVAHN